MYGNPGPALPPCLSRDLSSGRREMSDETIPPHSERREPLSPSSDPSCPCHHGQVLVIPQSRVRECNSHALFEMKSLGLLLLLKMPCSVYAPEVIRFL